MKIIKRWNIHECGWETFHRECAEVAKGRTDVYLRALSPGKLALVERGEAK